MNLPITREKALEFLKSFSQLDSDMNHYLESEAVMRALARLEEDEDYWGLLGLVHDIDWSETKKDWSQHTLTARKLLEKLGFDEDFISIVQSHGYGYSEIPSHKDKRREKKVEYALACSETVTGLIYSYALMRGRKISDMETKGLVKKFKDKSFAANCNREIILECEKIGIPISDFLGLAIEAIKGIKSEIGLS